MKTNIGEQGTEQFTVYTAIDGEKIGEQKIHDPFIHTTIKHTPGRWEHFKQIFAPKTIKIQVSVDGSHGAMRAIMTLDPILLQQDTEEILRERAVSRERNSAEGVVGYFSEASPA